MFVFSFPVLLMSEFNVPLFSFLPLFSFHGYRHHTL